MEGKKGNGEGNREEEWGLYRWGDGRGMGRHGMMMMMMMNDECETLAHWHGVNAKYKLIHAAPLYIRGVGVGEVDTRRLHSR
ncbi:hypothetical protein RIF29_41334 [Crotalaria pallida]|uniref:Uncharacterized protein n=1 Tax=Crotalaria pallida TaxID=3830 RepID=A0AAN9HRI7_CROPI